MRQRRHLILLSILTITLHASKSWSIEGNINEDLQEVDKYLQIEGRDGETDLTNTTVYLNKKIKQLLAENPMKNPSKSILAATLNAARSELENAFINETASEEAIIKAEQALENFKSLLQHYEKIEQMLEVAHKDLNAYETDPKPSLEEKYAALMLLLKLQSSSTFEEADMALKLYSDFKNGKNTSDTESVLPSLSDEHRKYFEEILKILKDHFIKDSLEMEDFLKQILKNPELLKEFYKAIEELSEEDYDEDDFLLDLWSLIF